MLVDFIAKSTYLKESHHNYFAEEILAPSPLIYDSCRCLSSIIPTTTEELVLCQEARLVCKIKMRSLDPANHGQAFSVGDIKSDATEVGMMTAVKDVVHITNSVLRSMTVNVRRLMWSETL